MVTIAHGGKTFTFETIKQSRRFAATEIAWYTIITVHHGTRTIYSGLAVNY